MRFFKKYIGDRAFYKMVLAVAVPMMIQNGITNFVNMLDNVMVGRLGTEQMSGVSIVNQFVFIFNLLIFGAISAAGIFTSQYCGKGDHEGVRNTFRFKFLINLVCTTLGIVAFIVFDEALINLFLHEGESTGDLALTLAYGKEYLYVTLVGLIPYAISQVYASTMRETGDAVTPMAASVAAVLTNLVLNAILIFGYLGAPALGVRGAAIATVISRFLELGILVAWCHTHTARFPYIKGALRTLIIPRPLFVRIAMKGLPIMANEFLWAVAMMLRNQCYSTRGLDVVAGQNIAFTLINVINVVYMSIGTSIGIIVGNQLGAGDLERAKDTDRKMMAFSIAASVLMGGILVGLSFLFPLIYKTTDLARNYATYMMIVSAAVTPFCAFAHSAYFTLRSGGKVMITILFDSVFMWGLVLPLSAVLAYFTEMSIYPLFAICQATEIVKMVFGIILLRKVNWAKQLDIVADATLQ